MTILLYLTIEILAILLMYISSKSTGNIIVWKIKISKSNIFFILSFILLASIIVGKSINVGVDTKSYEQAYLRIVNNTLTDNDISWLGFGFRYISKLLSYIAGNNYLIVGAIFGTFTLFLIMYTIYKDSKVKWLSLYIFVSFCLYYQILNQVRQLLAISIVFFAMDYIKKKNLKMYVLFILIAVSIHNSAIIALPLYFISKIRINKVTITVYTFFMFISFFGFDIIKLILGNTYYGLIYFNSGFDIEFSLTTILNLVLRVTMLILVLCFYRKIKDKYPNENFNYLYHMAILCTFLQVLATRSYIFGRLTTYFYISYILLIPIIFDYLEKENTKFRKRNILTYIAILAFAIYHIIYYYSPSGAIGAGYDNYTFFFQ